MTDISSPEMRRSFDMMARAASRFMADELSGRTRCHCGRFRRADRELCARHQQFAEFRQRLAEQRAARLAAQLEG